MSVLSANIEIADIEANNSLIDRAWLILLGASLCMFSSLPATILFTFGIFAPRITAETGWSAFSLAGAIALGPIISALTAPFVGRVADKLGARKLVILGGPSCALGFILLGYLSATPLSFLLLLGVACGLGFAATPIPYAQTVSGWFARRRGLALSFIFASSSLGIAFWSPYSSFLLTNFGWRHAYALVGATAGAIILLSGVLLIRNPPAVTTAESQSALPGIDVAQAVRSVTFWKIALVFMLLTGILVGSTVNLPTILRSSGIGSEVAASVISIVGLAMFAGRLSAGMMLDRWFSPHVTSIYVGLSLLGMGLMLIASSSPAFFLGAGLLGLGLGSELDAAAYMVSRAFGLRSFGAIYGLITLGYGICGALGAGTIGAAIAAGVTPSVIFSIGTVMLAVAVILLTTIRRDQLPFDIKS